MAFLTPTGHESELDCARWACVANGPAILDAEVSGDPELAYVAEAMLLRAGWTPSDLMNAMVNWLALHAKA